MLHEIHSPYRPEIFSITHPRHDLWLHVLHDLIPRLRIIRRLWRQQRPEIAGVDVWRNPPGMNGAHELADVFYHLLAASAKRFDVHGVFCAQSADLRIRSRIMKYQTCRRDTIFNISLIACYVSFSGYSFPWNRHVTFRLRYLTELISTYFVDFSRAQVK